MQQEIKANKSESIQSAIEEFATKNETVFLCGMIVSIYIEILHVAKRVIFSR